MTGHDLSRTRRVFDPEWLDERGVSCLGLGTIGCRISASLAHEGVPMTDTFDGDRYRDVNVSNQHFPHRLIGKSKALANQAFIRESVGHVATKPHVRRVRPGDKFSGFVFTALHDNDTRTELWHGSFKENKDVDLLIDARMGVDAGRIVAVDPNNYDHIESYEAHHLYTHAEAVRGGCTTDQSIGSTADIVAGYAVWMFKLWLQVEQRMQDRFVNFVGFSLRPPFDLETQVW